MAITLDYCVKSVNAIPVSSGPGAIILKMESRLFVYPDLEQPLPYHLDLRLDEQQIDQLLSQLQNLKKEMA
ncbi:hypothetical protein BA188_11745 [Aeromonas hydrophila]|nr:hypothetical protein OI72_05405 [Aeromonas hydrophila]OFC42765.1 hypothetical protein BA189_04435 [Aeromonas hydrophila]OFC52661.1 hypothetical protein BA188_11745 [Aeromonas hydrophila]